MFRIPAAEPTHDVMVPADLIPLSVLERDLPAPTTGWHLELDRRGIPIVTDDIGRPAITRADARQLVTERKEAEARQREAAERRDVELEAQRLRSLRPGIPASSIPEGLSPAGAMLAASYDARPRRQSVVEEALAGGTLTFHSYQPAPDDE
jgi:hypothetical protein